MFDVRIFFIPHFDTPMPLMPLLLLGLFGVSIPVLIHLLHRQKTQPVQWGAMQFLRISPLQMKQKKKVEHWLLMLLRMAGIAVLAFLLARPRLPMSRFIPKQWTDAPIDLVVIVDHSLSTGRMSGGKTVFDQSTSRLNSIIDQLKSTDTVSVILAEHAPRALNTQPIKKGDARSITALEKQLADEKPGMTDCSMPQAISAARHLLSQGRSANKSIIVISDQQRANWHIKDDALWRAAMGSRASADTQLVHSMVIAPDADVSNVSVSPPLIQPAILGINRPMQITADITNTGTQTSPAQNAQLIVNGKQLDTKPVPSLSPKSSATIRFDLDTGLPQSGSNSIKIAVDGHDALEADNSAVAAANVLQHIPVLVIDGQLSNVGAFKSSQFLLAALQPQDPSLVQANVVSLSDAMTTRLDDYMVVILNDTGVLPASLRDKLADYTRAGHGLWIILGPRTQQSTIEKEMNGLFTASVRETMNATDAPSGLEVKDPNNAVMKIVTGDEHNALTGAATRKWWAINSPDAQTVLSAGNGDPLVMERPIGISGGILCVWTSSVDGSWNNWNLMPNFVPLVNETIYHLSSASLHGLENRGLAAGQPIEWAGPAIPVVKSIRIELPDQTTVTKTPTFNHGRWLLTDPDTFLPGTYTLRFDPPQIPPVCYGVNIDRAELDPTALDADDVNWLKTQSYLDPAQPVITPNDLPTILRHQGQPPEIWGFLAIVLLINLLSETFLTYRLVGTNKPSNVADAGLVSPNV